MTPSRVSFVLFLAACSGPADPIGDPPDTDSIPTWHQDVAPIVIDNCTACHRPGGINAALDFTTYEGASQWKDAISLFTQNRSMPPFPADITEECDQPWGFLNDQRLTEQEIDTLASWAAGDAPLGDPTTAVPVSEPIEPTLERIDQVLEPLAPFDVPSADIAPDPQVCFLLDPQLATTGFLEGTHVVPDAWEVVHHVRLNLTTREHAEARMAEEGAVDGAWPCSPADNGTPIGGYAPGMGPQLVPEGSAIPIRPDQVIVAWVHYHAIDEARTDSTSVRVQWATEEPPARAYIMKSDTPITAAGGLLPGPGDDGSVQFLVPAGSADHTETFIWEVPHTGAAYFDVFSVLGHMHYVGTEFRMWVEKADGSDGPCLLHIPRWDFDWQLFYSFDITGDHPVVHPGDKIYVECTYNNTTSNPEVLRLLDEYGMTEPVDVPYGVGSNAEMCSMMVGAVPR